MEGEHEKPIYRGDGLKRGAWIVCRFKGGGDSVKNSGVVFEGGGGRGRYPSAHYGKVMKFSPEIILDFKKTITSLIIMGYRTPGLSHLLGRLIV